MHLLSFGPYRFDTLTEELYPIFDPLTREPRFQRLTRAIGLR